MGKRLSVREGKERSVLCQGAVENGCGRPIEIWVVVWMVVMGGECGWGIG